MSFTHHPYEWVIAAFPWGSDQLEEKEIRDWQKDILQALGKSLRNGDEVSTAIQHAVASGHGIGKSALVSWLILWAISTYPDTKGVVTANTEAQLKLKTWSELEKWYRMCITKTLFKYTATSIFSADVGHEKSWRVDMIPWSERNTEAFAGLHNEGRRILLIYDEASAIPDLIWEVSEGALTDENTEIIWCVFGNPTRNVGRFRECWGKFSHRWKGKQIDSRSVTGTNKKQFEQWIDDYGIESDFIKVRVLGVFPNASDMQFIPTDIVEDAMMRTQPHAGAALVMGVDVARYGDDRSVIAFRRGRDASSIRHKVYRGISTMDLADRVNEAIREYRPTTIFIDGVGVGGGVVDRLSQLGYGQMICEVNAGSSPDDKDRYKNKRAEMWSDMRDWLKTGSIYNDNMLRNDFIGIEYSFDMNGKLQLEKKEDMKRRGLASPDISDALSLTFAEAVAPEGYQYKPIKVRRAA